MKEKKIGGTYSWIERNRARGSRAARRYSEDAIREWPKTHIKIVAIFLASKIISEKGEKKKDGEWRRVEKKR